MAMRAFVYAALCWCALAFGLSAGPAQAGGYGGYREGQVWYSSSCCYRKLVRHQRDVFYVRAGAYIPGYAYPYRRAYAYAAPYRRVRLSEFDYYSRYGGYGRAGCFWQEVPVQVWPGWVWGVRTTCY
jgi:hypothetical protein